MLKRLMTFTVAVLVLTGLSACRKNTLEVICFAVGKADAILIRTENSAVLIDTGEDSDGEALVSALRERNIDKLDYLIITHFDKDHAGGANTVISSMRVEHILQPKYAKESKGYSEYLHALEDKGMQPEQVKTDLHFTLDSVQYTVYPAQKELYAEKPSNNSSLIIGAVFGQNSFLFAGDANNMRLSEFIENDAQHYDFLKVPYHGRYQEKLPEFLAAVTPQCAVITCSGKEPEEEETLDLLEQAGTEVYLTRKGTVTCSSDGKNIWITQ